MKDLSNKRLNIKIISITAFVIFFLFTLSFKIETSKKGFEFETTATIINKNALSGMTETEKREYFQNFWESIYYEQNIKPSNKKFYRRFNRAYAFWSLRLFNSQDDLAVLDASRPHLLSALFLDYTPDNFNSNISEWAENGDLDNIYLNDENFAYQVCDNKTYNGVSENDQYCSNNDGNNNDESYSGFTIGQLLLAQTADLIRQIQKYIDEKDTISALGRHLFVYEPSCIISEKNSDGSIRTFTYKYSKKYTFDEILDLFVNAKNFNIFSPYSVFPEYQNCVGPDSSWKEANGGKAFATVFNLNDTIDLCAFYEHLVESNYFENHPHFKADFATIRKNVKTDQEYLVEASKLKVGLARQIIDIVDISNEDDPVYDTSSTAATGGIASYSLSNDLYISISNSRTDSSGYVIRDGSYPIDQYVEGVLDAEVLGAFYGSGESASSIYTALQANAIAIRTYVLKVTKEGTKAISNSTSNQVFTDKFFKSENDRYVAARSAALSTTGQVLTENNQLIMSEYSSFSKNTNYRCEGDLCYTSYQKIGAKNSGTLHTVIAKKSWGLAGGHNRGMSQWGSLYLAANGYSYQQILADFYAENVKLANYDYSYKNTDRTASGEYGVKEAMLVCDLFTSSQYSDIRDLLGNNVTLEIPLRLTSTKYQSSKGYKPIDASYNNGINFYRDSNYGSTVPGSRKCEWNPETTALMYRCYHNEVGYMANMMGYWQNASGQFLDENGEPTTDPSKFIIIDETGIPESKMNDPEWIKSYVESGSITHGADVQLPYGIVWQYAINNILQAMGISDLKTEGGKTAHTHTHPDGVVMDGTRAMAGFAPTDNYGVYKGNRKTVETNSDGTPKTEKTIIGYSCGSADYKLTDKQCCLIEDKTTCEPASPIIEEKLVYSSSSYNAFSGKYARYANGESKSIPTEPNEVLYTGITDEEATVYADNNTRDQFVYANHVTTVLYAYTKDKNTLPEALKPFVQDTATNVFQQNDNTLGMLGENFASANFGLYELESSDGGSFINITEFLDSLGFASPGGRASGAISSLESHHHDALCDYYAEDSSDLYLANLGDDYCCEGLLADSGFGGTVNSQRKNYFNFNGEGVTYGQVSEALGGYFSDAWKIEFCTGTIEGRALLNKVCKIALTTQEGCYSQCYATSGDIKNWEKLGYTKDDSGNLLNKSGKHIYDYTKTAKHCQYDVTIFGGTGTYTDEGTKSIPSMRTIPYSSAKDDSGAITNESGGCSCELLKIPTGGGHVTE